MDLIVTDVTITVLLFYCSNFSLFKHMQNTCLLFIWLTYSMAYFGFICVPRVFKNIMVRKILVRTSCATIHEYNITITNISIVNVSRRKYTQIMNI